VEQFVTAEEAAQRLGYHIDHVYRLLRDGTIEAQQFNRVWMIDPAEVSRIKAMQGPGGRRPKRSESEQQSSC
jgi:excisionase family DNA binding protein